MIRTTTRNGFHIKFANEITVSVQWNPGNYCSDRDFIGEENEPRQCDLVEVAAWHSKTGDWIKLSDCDDVLGWQNANDVAEILYKISKMSAQ